MRKSKNLEADFVIRNKYGTRELEAQTSEAVIYLGCEQIIISSEDIKEKLMQLIDAGFIVAGAK
jgi:hypothetical protein